MKELDFGIRAMTIKEVADAKGVSQDVVKNCIRRIMPNKMQNGKVTLLSELEVASISKELKSNTQVNSHLTYEASSQVANTSTRLEIIANYRKATEDIIALLQAENEQQKQQLLEQQPKVDFFDDVAGSKDTIDMRDVATTLNIKNMGRNKIFALLRAKGVLDRYNQPYQKYVDKGFFRTIESMYTTKEGETKINIKTVVFQKGLDFIRGLVKTA